MTGVECWWRWNEVTGGVEEMCWEAVFGCACHLGGHGVVCEHERACVECWAVQGRVTCLRRVRV